MTFAARIRITLILVALLPPALMMLVVYTYSSRQEEARYRELAAEDLDKLLEYRQQFRDQLSTRLQDLARSDWFGRSVRLIERAQASQVSFNEVRSYGLDFCEITDSTGRVVASADRPGLVGETVRSVHSTTADSIHLAETIEYDIDGVHASLAGTSKGMKGYELYGGLYLERRFLPLAEMLLHGRIGVDYAGESSKQTGQVKLDAGSLYRVEDTLQAVLFESEQAGFVVTAEFALPDRSAATVSFIKAVSLVALASVLAAVVLGVFISLRARREFDNLVEAFGKVAGGDLNAAVMAYSEGEFSHLADSFSEMTRKLRLSQERLATSEKIAAWQSMARKIAHEIKNPLTPIGLSADDLRRSYQESLPDFDRTLDTNTRQIRSEVNRLTRLLDEFVAFARMKPPEFQSVKLEALVEKLHALYSAEIVDRRLIVESTASGQIVRIDPDLITQLLVNLVKNSLEADDTSTVCVVITRDAGELRVSVADTGPGFSEGVLARPFEPDLSTKKGGSGLGLAICQRIAHDHGGHIEMRNRREGGAEVVVRLPQN